MPMDGQNARNEAYHEEGTASSDGLSSPHTQVLTFSTAATALGCSPRLKTKSKK